MTTSLTKERAKEIATALMDKSHKRFRQELDGENEEFLDRVLRQFRAKIARCSWKASQKWCKFNNDGPVLMPDFTRMYYRKGSTEVLVQEYPPQIRLMKFMGALVNRANSTAEITEGDLRKIFTYSLALPYVIFLFKYVNGIFTEVRCAFSDRPLKRLEERPLRPYLSNIDSNLCVCLGSSFDRSQLEKDNIVQQSALVLSHFWQTVYSDEWSAHFWATKAHFQQCDPRMAEISAWQEASVENPLFVVEDVDWLKHQEENFGDMVVRMFEHDEVNHSLQEELYGELVDQFLDEVKKTFAENMNAVEQKVSEQVADQMADELLAMLNGA